MANGGARPGAGRPRSTARIAQQEQVVFKRLKGGAQLGWEALADKYPSLIRLAIAVAMGDEDGKPNVSMLKTLLELLPRVVGDAGGDDDTKLHNILGDIHAIIRESKGNGQSGVASDIPERSQSLSLPR